MTYPLSLIDLCFTLYARYMGIPEANPLMQCVPVMVVYRVVVIGVLCWVLHRFADTGNKVAKRGLRLLTVVYAVVDLYHVYFILR